MSSNKFILVIIILLVFCSIIFHNLPNNIYQNMLDLFFGFNALDVQKTFDALGEKGRINYIYSTLILDTVFPILYVLLFISILLKLNERRILFLFLPILAGIFDLAENIFISIMMASYAFSEISTSQIFFASMFNQFKWVLCFFSIIFILYKIISKKINP